MTTKANANIRVVTVKDLWYIFVYRLWVMALAAVVAVGGLFIIKSMAMGAMMENERRPHFRSD